MGNGEVEKTGIAGTRIAATSDELRWQVQQEEYQEVAAAVLNCHKEDLSEEVLKDLEKVVAGKPKFGYWTISREEYDRDYSLAMELCQLKVFKGSVCADRNQYKLARRLCRDHPYLVGINLFDYRRQYVVFLSPRAAAMRRFALVETAGQYGQESTIALG